MGGEEFEKHDRDDKARKDINEGGVTILPHITSACQQDAGVCSNIEAF